MKWRGGGVNIKWIGDGLIGCAGNPITAVPADGRKLTAQCYSWHLFGSNCQPPEIRGKATNSTSDKCPKQHPSRLTEKGQDSGVVIVEFEILLTDTEDIIVKEP